MHLTPVKYAPQTPPQQDNSEVGPVIAACPSAPHPTSSCSDVVAATGPLFPCLDAECRGQAAINIHHKMKIHKKQHYSAKRRIPVPVLTLKPRLSRHSSTSNNKFAVLVGSAGDMVTSSKHSSNSVVFSKSILPTQQEKGHSSLHFDDRSGEISLLLSAA